MDKLIDYIGWMGSLDFGQCPFREADALILCVISYFDLRPVFAAFGPNPRVRDCLPMIEAGEAKIQITGGDLGNSEIFGAAARSERFGSLTMSECVDLLQPETALQFAAVTFHDGERFSFLAYRGTDATLAGWKEDCMISFTRTEAQTMAADYAERGILAGPDDGRDWYIAGHSKGGNLALYAACMLSDAAWERVTRVFVLDGPGLCPEVMDLHLMDRIDGRTTRIVPEFEVIGKLFEPKITDTRIVKSSQGGIMQHSLASWLVDHGALAEAEAFDPISVWISQTMSTWIEDIAAGERPVFVNELFDSLGSNGMTSFDKLGVEDLRSALVELSKTSKTTRHALGTLPRVLIHESDAAEQAERPDKPGIVTWLKKTRIVRGVFLILVGLCVFLAPSSFVEVSSVVLAFAIALIYVGLTVRRLVRQRWSLAGMRERILLSIILLALCAVMAMHLPLMLYFGSIFFGVLCLVEAYISWEKAARAREDRFQRIMYIVECVLTLLYGAGFVLVPRVTVEVYAGSIGVLLMADGTVRLLRGLVVGIKGRRARAEEEK